jgi:carboxyl-terminal processing protease
MWCRECDPWRISHDMRIAIFAAVCFVCQTSVLEAQSFEPPAPSGQPKGAEQAPLGQRLYLRAADVLERRFYDPSLGGLDWPAEREALRPKAAAATTQAECSAVINELIARLRASHTRHFIPSQREYYELLDVFNPDGVVASDQATSFGLAQAGIEGGRVRYTGAGLVSVPMEGSRFVADVYPDGPADRAGIHVGDELLGVNDQPWSDIDAFKGLHVQPMTVRVRRERGGPELSLPLTSRSLQPRDVFLHSISASARVETHRDRSIAYVRVRSYAHPSYQEELVRLLNTALKDADGLIFDLRGGWGGAQPSYLEAFNTLVPVMEQARRGADWSGGQKPYTKPMVVLIDRGTRSGKEILAYGFKLSRRATLVGEPTAGAVLGGSPEILPDGSILLIAVADVVVNGERLEGIGVSPDINVARPIPYCNNADPQLDAAKDELVRELSPRAP